MGYWVAAVQLPAQARAPAPLGRLRVLPQARLLFRRHHLVEWCYWVGTERRAQVRRAPGVTMTRFRSTMMSQRLMDIAPPSGGHCTPITHYTSISHTSPSSHTGEEEGAIEGLGVMIIDRPRVSGGGSSEGVWGPCSLVLPAYLQGDRVLDSIWGEEPRTSVWAGE
jgi:hypothetical protein